VEVSGHLHDVAALSAWKRPRYPSDRRLGGPKVQSGHSGGEEKNSLPLPGKNPVRPVRNLVTMLTELTRFPKNPLLAVIRTVIVQSVSDTLLTELKHLH